LIENSFRDFKQQPTLEDIQSALGSCYPLWKRLTAFIEKSYLIEGKWSTWGPANVGWNIRYKYKGKALTALHPQRNRIFVQIVLGKVQAERALQLELGESVSKILQTTPQLRDGRWLHIPVTCNADAKDVEKLLLAKMQPPRK
jgi:hypothetical protein